MREEVKESNEVQVAGTGGEELEISQPSLDEANGSEKRIR